MRFVTDKAPENLAVIVVKDVDASKLLDTSNLRIDPVSKKLTVKPQLKLSAKKTELIGDGKDSAEIEVAVISPEGKAESTYNGKVKFSTTRGKLSAKGGLVQIKNGKGKVVLTSVNETVDRVSVTAHCVAGDCQKTTLEFEFM